MSEISPEYVSPTTGNGNAVEEFMSLLAEQSTRLDTQQGFVDAVRNELEQVDRTQPPTAIHLILAAFRLPPRAPGSLRV